MDIYILVYYLEEFSIPCSKLNSDILFTAAVTGIWRVRHQIVLLNGYVFLLWEVVIVGFQPPEKYTDH